MCDYYNDVCMCCVALTRAGREEEALRLLEELAENAIHETRFSLSSHSCFISSYTLIDVCAICRFEDAGHYYWLLAKSCMNHAMRDHLGKHCTVVGVVQLKHHAIYWLCRS